MKKIDLEDRFIDYTIRISNDERNRRVNSYNL